MSEIKRRCKLLIVDDDEEDRDHLKTAFSRDYDMFFAKDVENLQRILEKDYAIDLVLLDLVLDKSSKEKTGLQLIPQIQQVWPNVPIIIVTNDSDARTARAALKAGANDFLIKDDYKREDWKEVFEKALGWRKTVQEHKQFKAKVEQIAEKEEQEYVFIGQSPRIISIKQTLKVVSEEPNVTVLILGETGTGKEVAARFLHRQGIRRDKPFIAVNLSAIQETLLESTLFGSVKGAYTGSTRDVEGYFRQANGGMLMLDEIGDINHDIQIKLLRFLENRVIRPVGGDKDVKLDVQIVAATHQHLANSVQKGIFRADLFQRLKALTVVLPPLRERREDIPAILQHYLGPTLLYERTIDQSALQLLLHYDWVGNVRELRYTVNYMLLQLKIQQKQVIDVACLPFEIQEQFAMPKMARHQAESRDFSSIDVPNNSLPHSREEELTLYNLHKVEEALRIKNKVKKDAADDLGYKSADSMLYAIRTCYQKFPHLFDGSAFPYIRASYQQIFKSPNH